MDARGTIALFLAVGAVAAPGSAAAAGSTGGVAPGSTSPAPTSGGSRTGGAQYVPPPPPPTVARLVDGVAKAPAGAPKAVKRAIRAGNKLQDKPYRYGGGHKSFVDTAYDCSGTVSFALHGGKLLASPLDSTSFMSWGLAGPGRWITVYANAGHAYAVIAGLRLDTSGTGGSGPRWLSVERDTSGFVARHPAGL
jgi:cell wall-associated NlpC family hydrolase